MDIRLLEFRKEALEIGISDSGHSKPMIRQSYIAQPAFKS
jgi:hypothetical protein